MIQDDGRKRELVVGVVRANHRPHKSAGECNDSVGYYTSDGHLLNACDKNNTKSAQPVEGSRFTLEYNNSYGSETGMLEFPLHIEIKLPPKTGVFRDATFSSYSNRFL